MFVQLQPELQLLVLLLLRRLLLASWLAAYVLALVVVGGCLVGKPQIKQRNPCRACNRWRRIVST